MTIDKQNGEVAFSEATHQYFNIQNPIKQYISVTTLIHKFEQPFDKNFWSAYKAIEQLINPEYWKIAKKDLLSSRNYSESFLKGYDISVDDFNSTQQGILDVWQRESIASTTRGTEIHANLEHSFYAQASDISLQKYGVGGKFTCIQGNTDLSLENGIYPEYLTYYESPDQKIRLAGQIDLLAKQGNSFSILDWKGLPLDTPIPTVRGWKTMETLAVGDKVFDKDGMPCSVIHKSEIHNNPCFKITFEDGESIVADKDHRWLVHTRTPDLYESVMTTREIQKHLTQYPETKLAIVNMKPLSGADIDTTEAKLITPWGLATELERLGTIHYYLRASFRQRLRVLKDVFYTYIYRDFKKNLFVVKQTICGEAIAELLITFGCQVHKTKDGMITFPSFSFELAKALNLPAMFYQNYRIIKSVKRTKKVPTQCIEVDSPTHTYLCTKIMLVTHNTNKQIKTSSYYNQAIKKSDKMKYPLNDLDNCNYSVYNMQLSTYAWMIQQAHPDWECNELVLVHFNHNNDMTVYKMDYLKEQVEKMLTFWKKQSVLEDHKKRNKRIDY